MEEFGICFLATLQQYIYIDSLLVSEKRSLWNSALAQHHTFMSSRKSGEPDPPFRAGV